MACTGHANARYTCHARQTSSRCRLMSCLIKLPTRCLPRVNRVSTTLATMKCTQVLLAFGCCLLGFARAQDTSARRPYTTKYDNIDIEAVIKNERLLNNYIGCLLERGPCTADASEMKRNLPDALASHCGSCSEAQKRISDRLSHHLIDNRAEDWALLEEKYDPTGDYRRRYLHEREMQDNLNSNSNNNNNEDEEVAVTELLSSLDKDD